MNVRCLYCVLQSASLGTKALLCGFNLIMNPTLSAFFCSPSKLVWLLAAFKCWSICLSVSAEITSETSCLPLAFHFIHLVQQKGIKHDWLDPSSSEEPADLSAFSSTRVWFKMQISVAGDRQEVSLPHWLRIHSEDWIYTGSHPKWLFDWNWHQFSFKLLVVQENKDLLDVINSVSFIWRLLTIHQADCVHLTPVWASEDQRLVLLQLTLFWKSNSNLIIIIIIY